MFLKRFMFVNWGNIPNLEFEMGPINLFSGGNGSGKTTAADAIQTVMTAAHENLFQYNPGQDETTQRGRGGKKVRTLASYVLGCDDGSFARLEPTDGYLAAVFHPTQGETAKPFTAVIAVRAWLDQSGSNATARQDELQFFILPDTELTLGHFQREDKGGRYIVPLDKLPTLLVAEFGQRRLERYDTKKPYLRRLYAALRGRDDSVSEREAVAAARAFSRFMAYKPVNSINQFVAEEILERKDLGEAIRSISSQLKTIHSMEGEARRLVESIGLLEGAMGQAQNYIDQWIALNTLDYTLAKHAYDVRQQDYLHAKRAQEDLRRQIQENGGEIALASQRYVQVHETIVSLEAQRLGVDALRQKDELEARRREEQTRLVELGKQLLVQDNRLQQNAARVKVLADRLQGAELARELPDATDLETRNLVREALEKGRRADVDLHSLLQRDITGDLSALEQQLDQARTAQRLHNRLVDHWRTRAGNGESLRDRLAGLGQQRRARHDQLKAQHRQKEQEIERLETRQVSYPPHVERALAAIRAQCPQADPRVLCDHVEVTDSRWQSAIEGYLGGARFGIVVEPDHEAEAIRIVRAMPGRDNKARVIQGSKARRDAERFKPSADSIVHVLAFTHAVARDYFIANYGSVVRVESAEELRHTARGITADGMGSGGYSMFRCDLPDGELVFGAAARERALAAKRAELAQLAAEWQSAHARLEEAAQLLAAVDGLEPSSYADTLAGMLAAQRELTRLESLLSQLDLGEHRELEEKLDTLRQEERQWRERQEQLLKASGKFEEQLREADKAVTALADAQEETQLRVEQCEANLRAITADWPDFDLDARLDHLDAEAKELDEKRARNERAEIEHKLRAAERHMDGVIQEHNQHCRPGDAIVYTGFDGEYDAGLFGKVCAVRGELDRVYNLLKNNILVEKHDNLAQLKASFNNAFVTHLCHAIYQAIKDGERQVELLNRELQHHRFGADRETFRFASEWIPEYRDYWRFFEEVVKNPALGDEVTLFELELSGKSKRVRDEIMAMLLDEDEHKALRELERIADYRHYRRYEIFKEVEGKAPIPLSEYGTGSGGQLETPAYIIRSAAITSAFRFAEGQNHLRMVLVDEAFSKMDETRSREVIAYLTDSLGLQLVFIMPTSKCGPFMDLISHEFVFAKVPSAQARGQLQTRVLVDRKCFEQERVQALWAKHRRAVYDQAELDFMQDVLAG